MLYTDLILVFIGGGILSVIAQILIDLTKLTPARILVTYVTMGVLLFGIGAYEPLYEIFGCGVSTPLIGFGAAIGKGVKEAMDKDGMLGILSGGLSATAAGISAALFLGTLFALFTKGKSKRM
jgi:stage V sporulation protein AE